MQLTCSPPFRIRILHTVLSRRYIQYGLLETPWSIIMMFLINHTACIEPTSGSTDGNWCTFCSSPLQDGGRPRRRDLLPPVLQEGLPRGRDAAHLLRHRRHQARRRRRGLPEVRRSSVPGKETQKQLSSLMRTVPPPTRQWEKTMPSQVNLLTK